LAVPHGQTLIVRGANLPFDFDFFFHLKILYFRRHLNLPQGLARGHKQMETIAEQKRQENEGKKEAQTKSAQEKPRLGRDCR
jgi:hypothetical protein